MSIEFYMNYLIFFNNYTEYQAARQTAGNTNLIKMAPRDAATAFGIPYPYPPQYLASTPKGIYFFDIYTPGAEYDNPGPSGIFVDDTILSQTVPGQAGHPPSIWPAAEDSIFTWSGFITYNGITSTITPIARRRFIGGHEIPFTAEGGTSTTDNWGRDFSRTIDGYGYSTRGGSATGTWDRVIAEFRGGTFTSSWERFYIRVRRLPVSVNVGLWLTAGISGNVGTMMKLNVAGTIEVFGRDSGGILTSKGVILTPTINTWYRFDVFLLYRTSGGGIAKYYINGAPILGTDFPNDGGTGAPQHVSSSLGNWTTTDVEVEVDFDDWINADLPGNVSATTLLFNDTNYSIDWLLGSHIRQHHALSALQTNWATAGMAVGVENQDQFAATILGTSELTSSTALARLEGLTDAQLQNIQDSEAQVLGVAAGLVSIRSINAGATDGQLGYRVAGGSPVLTTIDQTAAATTRIIPYLPSGMVLPTEVSPWSMVHDKSNDANLDTVRQMGTVLEYLGIWGPEDNPLSDFPISRLTFLHNSAYGNTIWGYAGSQPIAPCYAIGGTYVGNGTYQEISLPVPIHFLWIRATSGSPTAGLKYFAASNGGHLGATDRVIPNFRTWYDASSQTYKFSVVGNSIEINQNAITYQYVAFGDPGMRYSLCGAFMHASGSPSPIANPLIATDFTPIAGFVQLNVINSVSSSPGLWFKGPGNAGNQACTLDASGNQANFGNFAAQVFNSASGIVGRPGNYSLWRISDSGADGCAGVMVQILSYTGNGTNPRNITLTPTSGRFPLFVLVCPQTNANSFFRDPSHTGSNSASVQSLTNSTVAITAVAVDQITVNSALNSNGIVYNVFVIPGDIAGMNNGIFYPTYCDGDGPYIPPTTPIPGTIIIGNGGLILNGAPSSVLLKDVSGIYTLVSGQKYDKLIDRTAGGTTVNVKIPDPTAKTGYLGG